MSIETCKNAQNILSKTYESNQWADSSSHQKSMPATNGTCKMFGRTKSFIWFELQEVVLPYLKQCLCERSATFMHSFSYPTTFYIWTNVLVTESNFYKVFIRKEDCEVYVLTAKPVSGVNDMESKHKICHSRAGIHSYWIKLNIETLVAAGVQYFSSLLQKNIKSLIKAVKLALLRHTEATRFFAVIGKTCYFHCCKCQWEFFTRLHVAETSVVLYCKQHCAIEGTDDWAVVTLRCQPRDNVDSC